MADYVILWETWLDKVPLLIDRNYDIYQTVYSKYQGVWILARKGSVEKVFTNNDPYMIAVQAKNAGKAHFAIRVYFKESEKTKILDTLWALIKRIRRKYIKPIITIFGDFNTNHREFTIEMIEKRTSLTAINTNKSIATRVQTRGTSNSISTLDYFLSSEMIENFKTMDKAGSDHLAIVAGIRLCTDGQIIKKENRQIIKRVIPKSKDIKSILSSEEWPNIVDLNITRKIWQRQETIRLTIKIQEIANNLFKQENWENANIDIKWHSLQAFRNISRIWTY